MDRRNERTYTLQEPIPHAGEELTEITFRRLRGRTYRILAVEASPGDQTFLLLNELTGLPFEVLDSLGLVDALVVSKIAGDLLEKKLAEAKAVADELGLEGFLEDGGLEEAAKQIGTAPPPEMTGDELEAKLLEPAELEALV